MSFHIFCICFLVSFVYGESNSTGSSERDGPKCAVGVSYYNAEGDTKASVYEYNIFTGQHYGYPAENNNSFYEYYSTSALNPKSNTLYSIVSGYSYSNNLNLVAYNIHTEQETILGPTYINEGGSSTKLSGMDYNENTDELYAVNYDNNMSYIWLIDPSNAKSTLIGEAQFGYARELIISKDYQTVYVITAHPSTIWYSNITDLHEWNMLSTEFPSKLGTPDAIDWYTNNHNDYMTVLCLSDDINDKDACYLWNINDGSNTFLFNTTTAATGLEIIHDYDGDSCGEISTFIAQEPTVKPIAKLPIIEPTAYPTIEPTAYPTLAPLKSSRIELKTKNESALGSSLLRAALVTSPETTTSAQISSSPTASPIAPPKAIKSPIILAPIKSAKAIKSAPIALSGIASAKIASSPIASTLTSISSTTKTPTIDDCDFALYQEVMLKCHNIMDSNYSASNSKSVSQSNINKTVHNNNNSNNIYLPFTLIIISFTFGLFLQKILKTFKRCKLYTGKKGYTVIDNKGVTSTSECTTDDFTDDNVMKLINMQA